MKFSDMQKDIAYEVTKGSPDGTFEKGDIIVFLSDDKSLMTMRRNRTLGWLTPSDYAEDPQCIEFECKVSEVYYIHHTGRSVKFDYIPQTSTVYPWNRQLEAIRKSKEGE